MPPPVHQKPLPPLPLRIVPGKSNSHTPIAETPATLPGLDLGIPLDPLTPMRHAAERKPTSGYRHEPADSEPSASGSIPNHPPNPAPHRIKRKDVPEYRPGPPTPATKPAPPAGRQINGPEDFNAYEKKRVEQAESSIKLGKIAIAATVVVGVTGIVLSGLNFGSNQDKPPGQ